MLLKAKDGIEPELRQRMRSKAFSWVGGFIFLAFLSGVGLLTGRESIKGLEKELGWWVVACFIGRYVTNILDEFRLRLNRIEEMIKADRAL